MKNNENFISLDEIKKMSLIELLFLLTDFNVPINKESEEKIIYNTEELIANYPIFTKYSLDIAIKKEGLPLFRIGHKRYFDKGAIDKWIIENNKPIVIATEKKRKQ